MRSPSLLTCSISSSGGIPPPFSLCPESVCCLVSVDKRHQLFVQIPGDRHRRITFDFSKVADFLNVLCGINSSLKLFWFCERFRRSGRPPDGFAGLLPSRRK